MLGIAPLLVGISDVLGVQLLLPMGLRQHYARIRMQGTVVNLAFVIPATLAFGAVGTAAGTVSAELFILGAMTLIVRRNGFRFLGQRNAPAPIPAIATPDAP